MNILVLAAGGQDTNPTQGQYPLFLHETNDGRLLIERLVSSWEALSPSRFIVCVRQHDISSHHIDNILSLISATCTLVEIRRETMGAACTALLAVDHIDLDGELIVTTATDFIDAPLLPIVKRFRASQADAGAITFDALHPRYSYAKVDADGWIVETAEKRPISRQALAGFYWFRRGGDFVDAVERMIVKDAKVHGRYFVAPALNELVLGSKSVMAWTVPSRSYHPYKSPEQVSTADSPGEAGLTKD